MIAIVDYGVGNLFSIARSLEYLGIESCVTGDAERLEAAERIILPGVGAFGDAMEKLRGAGLMPVLRACAARGVPLMGICLGMQLLFEESEEYGRHAGLGLLPGRVKALKGTIDDGLKVPQMGWNALDVRRAHRLVEGIGPGDCVYYVHSYYAVVPESVVVATSEYGVDVPGVVAQGNIMGCQFHPEKSGPVGLGILNAFARIPARA